MCTSWTCSALLFLTVSFGAPPLARAQAEAPQTSAPERQGHRGASIVTFLAGGVAGLTAHEAGHVVFDAAFGAEPGLKRVSFGPIPFFAITHEPVGPKQEFAISSAGRSQPPSCAPCSTGCSRARLFPPARSSRDASPRLSATREALASRRSR